MNLASVLFKRILIHFSVFRVRAIYIGLMVAVYGLGANAVYAQTSPLNDTGIIVCYSPNSPCDPVQHKLQDAMVGRDTAARVPGSGLTTNTGKGFSFTKISRIGNVLPDSATLGSNPDDWACTRDNVTGLIWEIKTTSPTSSRYVDSTYTWYNPDSATNGGHPGAANGGSCAVSGRCDTQKYVDDIRGTTLCGKSDWRLPTPKQLQGLFDLGNRTGSAALPAAFFPNTPSPSSNSRELLTSVTDAGTSVNAWYVNAPSGIVSRVNKGNAYGVIAVAGP